MTAGIRNLRRAIRKRGAVAGPYRFLKLTCSNSNGGSLVTLAEVQMRPTPGVGASMAGATATAQNQTGSNAPSYAVDGIVGTAWTSSTSAAWWQCELPTGRDFNELYVYPGGSTHFNNCPRTIVVEYSEDGVTWISAGTWNISAWVQGVAQTFAIP